MKLYIFLIFTLSANFLLLTESTFQDGLNYRIRSWNANKYLLNRGPDDRYSADQVTFRPWKNENRYKFRAIKNSSNQFLLVTLQQDHPGQTWVLDQNPSSHILTIWVQNGGSNQRWTAQPTTDEDAFLIKNVESGRCMQFPGTFTTQPCQPTNKNYWWAIEETS